MTNRNCRTDDIMRSGLQQQVLKLYRRALRAIRSKSAHTRPRFLLTVRYAFRAPEVGQRDFGTIEFMLRRGRRQIETWESPSVRDCWVSQDMREWERKWRQRAG